MKASEPVTTVAAIGIEVETREFATLDEAAAYMNSPEQLAPFNAYADGVKRLSEEGLCEEDLATFRLWWGGGKIDWQAIREPAYRAIMHAISMGCG